MSVAMRGGMRSARGQSWGLPGLTTKFPLGAMQLPGVARGREGALQMGMEHHISRDPEVASQEWLLESGSASCTARRLGREEPMQHSLLTEGEKPGG